MRRLEKRKGCLDREPMRMESPNIMEELFLVTEVISEKGRTIMQVRSAGGQIEWYRVRISKCMCVETERREEKRREEKRREEKRREEKKREETERGER